MITTEEQLWQNVTHARCYSCDVTRALDGINDIHDEEDFEDFAYEALICCQSPHYVAVIITEAPQFGDADEEINKGRFVVLSGQYKYELNDDFMDEFEEWKEQDCD